MAELNELNEAIRNLTVLWEACEDADKKEEILKKRKSLSEKARKLTDDILKNGGTKLEEAITALNSLTAKATEAKKDIDEDVKRIEKIADVLEKATKAIAKLAALGIV